MRLFSRPNMWDDVTSNASTKHPKIVVYSIKDKVRWGVQDSTSHTRHTEVKTLYTDIS